MIESASIAQQFVAQVAERFRQQPAAADDDSAEWRNIRTTQQLYKAICAGEFEAVVALMSEDVQLDIEGPGPVEFVRQVRGRQQMASVLRHNFATVADQQPEAQQVLAQGNMVSVFGYERGWMRADQRTYEVHWVHVFQFENGQVVRIHQTIGPITYGARK